jgi:nucleoid-associated protein YgaU
MTLSLAALAARRARIRVSIRIRPTVLAPAALAALLAATLPAVAHSRAGRRIRSLQTTTTPPPWTRPGGSVPPHLRGGVGAGDTRAAVNATPRRQRLRRSAATYHVVRRGDTLWDIASARLGTSDPARIAAYWPSVYRLNRATIGPDPDLLMPGEKLVLPPAP